jgi:hypothetical protein
VGDLPYWPKLRLQGPRSKSIEQIRRRDRVVYGLPVGTIKRLMPDAPQPWIDCATHVKTVGTVGLQLWLTAPVERYAPWAAPDITVGAYTEPFDTWSEMRLLVGERAAHGQPPIASVAYFANVIPKSLANGSAGATWFVEGGGLAGLWPGFEREMILDQYVQTNVDESSSYTLSLPGTLRYRLSPRDDSITNVRPVGDWTRNSISAGCIEAAVISGMLAANALLDCGLNIVGENGLEDMVDDRSSAQGRVAFGVGACRHGGPAD